MPDTHETLLLNEILERQKSQDEKLDRAMELIRNSMNEIPKMQQTIMSEVGKCFVHKEEFPHMWDAQMEATRVKQINKLETFNKLAMWAKNWVGWAVAAALFISANYDKIVR